MFLGPGSTIGPFKIQSLIGKGGMGEVFSTLDTRVDRKVVAKSGFPHGRNSRLT